MVSDLLLLTWWEARVSTDVEDRVRVGRTWTGEQHEIRPPREPRETPDTRFDHHSLRRKDVVGGTVVPAEVV